MLAFVNCIIIYVKKKIVSTSLQCLLGSISYSSRGGRLIQPEAAVQYGRYHFNMVSNRSRDFAMFDILPNILMLI